MLVLLTASMVPDAAGPGPRDLTIRRRRGQRPISGGLREAAPTRRSGWPGGPRTRRSRPARRRPRPSDRYDGRRPGATTRTGQRTWSAPGPSHRQTATQMPGDEQGGHRADPEGVADQHRGQPQPERPEPEEDRAGQRGHQVPWRGQRSQQHVVPAGAAEPAPVSGCGQGQRAGAQQPGGHQQEGDRPERPGGDGRTGHQAERRDERPAAERQGPALARRGRVGVERQRVGVVEGERSGRGPPARRRGAGSASAVGQVGSPGRRSTASTGPTRVGAAALSWAARASGIV